jgi:hypothetical protein
MAKRDRNTVPLMRYLTRKLGVRRGYMCMSFIVAWGTAEELFAQEQPDEVFNVTRYFEWWKISEATAMREQRLFREAFPDMSTPAELLALARERRVAVQDLQWSP